MLDNCLGMSKSLGSGLDIWHKIKNIWLLEKKHQNHDIAHLQSIYMYQDAVTFRGIYVLSISQCFKHNAYEAITV